MSSSYHEVVINKVKFCCCHLSWGYYLDRIPSPFWSYPPFLLTSVPHTSCPCLHSYLFGSNGFQAHFTHIQNSQIEKPEDWLGRDSNSEGLCSVSWFQCGCKMMCCFWIGYPGMGIMRRTSFLFGPHVWESQSLVTFTQESQRQKEVPVDTAAQLLRPTISLETVSMVNTTAPQSGLSSLEASPFGRGFMWRRDDLWELPGRQFVPTTPNRVVVFTQDKWPFPWPCGKGLTVRRWRVLP